MFFKLEILNNIHYHIKLKYIIKYYLLPSEDIDNFYDNRQLRK
jgi:hypothetical protein